MTAEGLRGLKMMPCNFRGAGRGGWIAVLSVLFVAVVPPSGMGGAEALEELAIGAIGVVWLPTDAGAGEGGGACPEIVAAEGVGALGATGSVAARAVGASGAGGFSVVGDDALWGSVGIAAL